MSEQAVPTWAHAGATRFFWPDHFGFESKVKVRAGKCGVGEQRSDDRTAPVLPRSTRWIFVRNDFGFEFKVKTETSPEARSLAGTKMRFSELERLIFAIAVDFSGRVFVASTSAKPLRHFWHRAARTTPVESRSNVATLAISITPSEAPPSCVYEAKILHGRTLASGR